MTPTPTPTPTPTMMSHKEKRKRVVETFKQLRKRTQFERLGLRGVPTDPVFESASRARGDVATHLERDRSKVRIMVGIGGIVGE